MNIRAGDKFLEKCVIGNSVWYFPKTIVDVKFLDNGEPIYAVSINGPYMPERELLEKYIPDNGIKPCPTCGAPIVI